MRWRFYCKKDTVFKLIHIFRLGCIGVAGRETDRVILQVIVDGVTDQGFSVKEESASESPCLALVPQCALQPVHLRLSLAQNPLI